MESVVLEQPPADWFVLDVMRSGAHGSAGVDRSESATGSGWWLMQGG